MFCKNCGKEIDDNAVVCPSCGVATDNMKLAEAKPEETNKKVNGLGIAGFVVAILSLGLGIYFCIASIVAVVLSAIAMVLKKKYTSCNGLAIAGLVVGIISLAIWALVWLIVGAALLSL